MTRPVTYPLRTKPTEVQLGLELIPKTDWRMPDDFPDLSGHGMIAIDVETYDPHLTTHGPGAQRRGCFICGVSVGTERELRRYYPIQHVGGYPNMDRRKVLDWLSEQLSRPGQPKVGANLLYDLNFLTQAGVEVAGPYYDVQVAEPLLDENQFSYTLESIAQRRLNEGKRDGLMAAWIKHRYGPKNIKGNIWRTPPQLVGPYAEGDVDLPLRIFAQQKPELEAQGLWDLFIMESKLIPVLLAMRRRGVRVNVPRAEELREDVIQRKLRAEAEIKRITGIAPNIWAADSLKKVFDTLGPLRIDFQRTGKTNAPSFRKDWLAAVEHPVGRLVVEARTMDKFRSTFLEGYIINDHTRRGGRIHCEFNQLRGDGVGAVSGRFSSSHPNLQNIPIRDPVLGPLIRNIFGPEKDQQWWKIDWSQIEFRLAVHYAALLKLPGVQRVVDQYHTDSTTDYHRVTAELTGLSRASAKSINFGIIYGLGIDKLCASLGVTREQGQNLLHQYHSKLPFVKPLFNTAMYRARDKGEISTLLHRKRRFDKWQNGERAYCHKALNAVLQGSAADIMKKAMVLIYESGAWQVLGAPHLTVHDELDGSLPPGPAAAEALAEVRHIMETCVPLRIPLVADLAVGESWGNTK